MEWLNKEHLLKNPVYFKNQRNEALILLLNSLQLRKAKFLTSDDLKLMICDIWAMLEIGESYKGKVTEREVKHKQFRLFILEFLVENGVLDTVKPQSSSIEKRFFTALLFGQKLASSYVRKLETLWDIDDYSLTDEQKQQKLLDIQRNWFLHLYKYEKEFQTIIYHVLNQLEAVEQVLSQDVWTTINEDYFDLLLKSIQANYFDEIFFWKEKFKKHPLYKREIRSDCSYVFCIQQDSSMRRYLHLQSALVSNIHEKVQQSNAHFIFVPFAETIEKEIVALNGTLHVEQFFQLNQCHERDGHINYKNALNYALFMSKLELNKNDESRIYFLCNEEVYNQMPDDFQWQEAVKKFKQDNNISIIAVYLGDLTKYREIWFADNAILPEKVLAQLK